MATSLEELERRVLALESELATLRRELAKQGACETPAERGARMMREGKASQAEISRITAEVFAKMGITGEVLAPEEVQEMMRAAGVNPHDNTFSREIIAARDE